MKQLFFYLLFSAFVNCNNQGISSQGNTDSSKQALTTSSVADNVPAGNCGSLIFFQKGAIVQGATYDSTGKEIGKQTTTITDVKEQGGELVSNIKLDMSSSFGNHSMNAEYKCNGNSFYMDLKTTMSNFTALKGATIESSSLQFPIQLSVGQNLPDASVSISMDRGSMKMKTTSTHTDRKVEKIEKVTTPAGTWTCFKVTSTIKVTTDMGSMGKRSAPSQKMIAWFAPDFGIVKTEMYSNDKLATRSLVISVKK